MTKKQNPFISALIIGGIGAVLIYVLRSLYMSPVINAMLLEHDMPINRFRLIVFLLGLPASFVGMFLAGLTYYKLIAKEKFPALFALLFSLAGALVLEIITCLISTALTYVQIPRILTTLLYFLLDIAVSAAAGLLLTIVSKPKTPVQPQYIPPVNANPYVGNPYVNNPYATAGAQAATTAAQPDNADELMTAVLNAIRPSLKAPLTAVLCDREAMTITNNGGVYTIEGYVNSQNSYGAMLATDFRVTATQSNGVWVITSTSVGVKTAKNNAKNFAVNYIVISIFVAIMAFLGFILLQAII